MIKFRLKVRILVFGGFLIVDLKNIDFTFLIFLKILLSTYMKDTYSEESRSSGHSNFGEWTLQIRLQNSQLPSGINKETERIRRLIYEPFVLGRIYDIWWP